MKARVLFKFYDTEAKVVRKKGDVIDITPARFTELRINGGFVEAFAEDAQNAETEKK